jgi:NAD(P)-dependent dehydrogenase (short-subunit alcohol dehydrogenase family)
MPRGIGHATARALAERGSRHRQEPSAQALMAWACCACRRVLEQARRIDVLVNNAGAGLLGAKTLTVLLRGWSGRS